MRIVICDDDNQDVQLIYEICKNIFEELGLEIEIDIFNKSEDILEYKKEIQLLILDIEISGINGIELKRILQKEKREINIIFVTNHKKFMPSAFGLCVFGFEIKYKGILKKIILGVIINLIFFVWIKPKLFFASLFLGICFTYILIEGTKTEKIKSFCASETIIAIVELSIWSLFRVMFINTNSIYEILLSDYRMGKMGCGVVAMTDIELYMTQQNNGYSAPSQGIKYDYLSGRIEKDIYEICRI